MPKYSFGFTFEVDDDDQAKAVARHMREKVEKDYVQTLARNIQPESLFRAAQIETYRLVEKGEEI